MNVLISFYKNFDKKHKYIFISLFLIKIFISSLFSSNYQNNLFIPFVDYFLNNFSNPWEFYHQIGKNDIFPYPPFMLYVLSFFYSFYNFLPFENIIFQNFFFKIPILLSDLIIFFVLIKSFPNQLNKILLFYFFSPIVLYASFMHSQLDIIPTSLLFISILFLLQDKVLISGLLFGLSIGTKHHTVIALPLILIYLFKNFSLQQIFLFISILMTSLFLIFIPVLGNPGFYSLVLNNPKQNQIFETFLQIGDLKLFLPIFVSGIFYARFFVYKKINKELLYAYLNLLFSSFIMLTTPTPGWYIWVVPYLSIFLIKYNDEIKYSIYVYLLFSISFLVHFFYLYIPEYPDLIIVNNQINFKIDNNLYANISYTFLQIILIGNIYLIYKIGVKSNQVYRDDKNLVIGISGDSASGKTTLVNNLKKLFGGKLVEIEGDGDHKWERGDEKWNKTTPLDPKANYIYRQYENISNLKSGNSILRVDYDHNVGRFTNEKKIMPSDFIVLSGLHTFYLPKMRKVVDLKIYLDTESKLRNQWKINRDVLQRGYDKDTVLENIEKRKNDGSKYVLPQKEYADLIIRYYYLETSKELDNPLKSDGLGLSLTFNSNLNIDDLIILIEKHELNYQHEYSTDLINQYIILENQPDSKFFNDASNLVINIDEITKKLIWADGYNGFIQLLILIHMSELLKSSFSYDKKL